MFVQIISGKVSDPELIRERGRVWEAELRPGAKGFLGSTLGVTGDGRFLVTARFESAAAARANSERPEQGRWWAETEKVVSDVEFHDCSRVHTLFGGGKDSAGFVQVMRGRVRDRAKADAMFTRAAEAEQVLGGARPDVIGEVIALHDDGEGYDDIIYFSSEAEARANEAKPWPADAQALLDEMSEAMEVTEFFDLSSPMMT